MENVALDIIKVRHIEQHHFQTECVGQFPIICKGEKKKNKKTFFSFLPEKNLVFFLKQFLSFIPVFHPQRLFFPLNNFFKKPKQHNGRKLFKVHWSTHHINFQIDPGIVGGLTSDLDRAVEQVGHATAGAHQANPPLRSQGMITGQGLPADLCCVCLHCLTISLSLSLSLSSAFFFFFFLTEKDKLLFQLSLFLKQLGFHFAGWGAHSPDSIHKNFDKKWGGVKESAF